jgi:hypothetical protein
MLVVELSAWTRIQLSAHMRRSVSLQGGSGIAGSWCEEGLPWFPPPPPLSCSPAPPHKPLARSAALPHALPLLQSCSLPASPISPLSCRAVASRLCTAGLSTRACDLGDRTGPRIWGPRSQPRRVSSKGSMSRSPD